MPLSDRFQISLTFWLTIWTHVAPHCRAKVRALRKNQWCTMHIIRLALRRRLLHWQCLHWISLQAQDVQERLEDSSLAVRTDSETVMGVCLACSAEVAVEFSVPLRDSANSQPIYFDNGWLVRRTLSRI